MGATTKKTVTALSRREIRFVPENWGKSELFQLLDAAEQQGHATYAAMPEWVETLEAVDSSLVEMSPTFFHEIDADRQTATRLFMRAFGTFRAAVRLVISGQLFETTVLIRSIIESSMYAWACAHSEPHRSAWGKRSSGKTEKSAARDAFAWGKLKAMLTNQRPDLAERVANLYDQMIEVGAHPNVDGIMLNCETRQIADDKFEISTIFLHGEEAVLIGVLDLLRAMELCYQLLDLTIHDRLCILGIDERVANQNARLVQLIEKLEESQQLLAEQDH